MNRVEFKTVAVADQGGAMEADTIKKNGRCQTDLLKFVAALFTVSIFLFSCDKDKDKDNDDDGSGSGKGNVYVVGSKLWKNGEVQKLSDGTDHPGGNSVFVSGNDVYVAGNDLWKNGEKQSGYSGELNSVFVSGNDLYVAGTDNGARLWKNGVPQNLAHTVANSSSRSSAYSVYVSGGKVFVAGEEKDAGGRTFARLWVNGEAQELQGSENNSFNYTSARSVFVKGTDVYVAGDEIINVYVRVPTLWVNGVPQNLKKSDSQYLYGKATSVYKSGNDVYVAVTGVYEAGSSMRISANLCKNGEMQVLYEKRTTNTLYEYSAANSVCVSGKNVYVAGVLSGRATIWKNDEEPQRLRTDTDANSIEATYAQCVFID